MNEELKKLVGDVVLPEDENQPSSSLTVEDLGPEPEQQPADAGELEPEPEPVETGPVLEPGPEKPAKEPETVPLPVFMDVKHELRETKREIAQLRSEMRAAVSPPVLEKDPLEVYIESQGGDPDTPIPASVYRRHEQWKDSQTEAKTIDMNRTLQEQAFNYASQVTMSAQVLGEGLGLNDIIEIGSKYLSEGDKLDIRQSGPDLPKLYYVRCFKRTLESGTPDAQVLKARLKATGKFEAPAPPNKPNEAPGRKEILKGNWPKAKELGLISP